MNARKLSLDSEGVWREFSRRLRLFVAQSVKQRADVDDIVQEIFVRIHANLSSVEDEVRLPAWIFAIARNAIADHFRKTSRSPDALPNDFDQPAPGGHWQPEPAAEEELSRCLQPMIEALPESYRQAIQMTELSGLSQVAAAEQAGLSVSGMKSRVQRGRQKLKHMLLKCCEVESDSGGRIMSYEPREGNCKSCFSDGTNAFCGDTNMARLRGLRRP